MYRMMAKSISPCWVLLTVLLLVTRATNAQDGLIVTDVFGNDHARQALIQLPGGEIVTAGMSSADLPYFSAVRHLSDGTFDDSFGDQGVALIEFSDNWQNLTSAVAQPDGKIILAGTASFSGYKAGSYYPDDRFALARLTADGAADKSFGRNGLVTTKLEKSTFASLNKVLLQDDGKIVAVGKTEKNWVPGKIALCRYLPNGRLDSTFGSRGIVLQPRGNPTMVTGALQTDGKIIVGGKARLSEFEWDCLLARFHTDGSLDTSFGNAGFVQVDLGGGDEAIDEIVVQDDDSIVAVGHLSPDRISPFVVMRFTSGGQLDNSFGDGGLVVDDVFIGETDQQYMHTIELQADGKMVAAGTHFAPDDAEGFLIRYNSDGTRDATFGNPSGNPGVPDGFEGVVLGPAGATIYDIVLRSEGDDFSILCVGYTYPGPASDFTLSRYLSDGVPDLLFGVFAD